MKTSRNEWLHLVAGSAEKLLYVIEITENSVPMSEEGVEHLEDAQEHARKCSASMRMAVGTQKKEHDN